MVTITNFHEVERKDGTTFISLELTGQAELLQSETTRKWYAKARRCRIPTTFDATIAKSLIGQQLPGEILKTICQPYEYVNPRTGEVMMLQHSYSYSQDSNPDNAVGHTIVSMLEVAPL